MSDFRELEDGIFASPQIDFDDLRSAAGLGVRLVINNRPDGEAADQPEGSAIEMAARELGMDYVAIPITHSGFSLPQVETMMDVLSKTDGPVLAYCRSGTRSTLLWALAQAKLGRKPDDLAQIAAGAGYDLAPIRPVLDSFAAEHG